MREKEEARTSPGLGSDSCKIECPEAAIRKGREKAQKPSLRTCEF